MTTYQYDAFGNLRRVDLPNGDVVEYVIDGQNRRVGRKVNGGMERGWLYRDQLQVVAELEGTGAVRQRFVRAAGEHSPDVVVEGGVSYRVVKDQVGTVVGVVSSTGTVALTRRTKAFGEVEEETGGMELRVGFAGGLVEAGTGAVRFGARDYLPAVGRWTAKDPIRWDGHQSNIFAYVSNNPIKFFDFNGMEMTSCDWAMGFTWTWLCGLGFAYLPPQAGIPLGLGCSLFATWHSNYICSYKPTYPPDPEPELPSGGACFVEDHPKEDPCTSGESAEVCQ